ncbi:MAG: hypothetical protein RLZZ628_2062 [Bacteroidota bacterium]|jgi:hypothetical protein
MRLWNTVLPKTSQWKSIRSVLVLIAPKERFPDAKVISFSDSPNPFLYFYFCKLERTKWYNIVSFCRFQTALVTTTAQPNFKTQSRYNGTRISYQLSPRFSIKRCRNNNFTAESDTNYPHAIRKTVHRINSLLDFGANRSKVISSNWGVKKTSVLIFFDTNLINLFKRFVKIHQICSSIQKKMNMNIKSLQNQVMDLIARARTPEAVSILLEWAKHHGNANAKHHATLISSEWSALQTARITGVLRADEERVRSSKLNTQIIHFEWTTQEPIIDDKRVTTDLNILFMGVNPFKVNKVPLHEMFYEIQKRLQNKKTTTAYTLKEQLFARKKDFQAEILNAVPKPNIIHFTGLGKLTKAQKDKLCKATQVANWDLFGGLIFHDRDYQSIESVNAEDIGGYFKYFVENEKLPIHTVFLSACYAAPQAKAIAQSVPYVVGMRKEVENNFVLDFSEAFYSALADGKTVPEAFERAQALADRSKVKEFVRFYVRGELQQWAS